MEYTRISSGSPFWYMVPIMPFASFLSIPHHIPSFHATALETNQSFLQPVPLNQKGPILIACVTFSFLKKQANCASSSQLLNIWAYPFLLQEAVRFLLLLILTDGHVEEI